MRPIIENKSYWDKSNDTLGHIARDAKQAMDLNPDCPTALKWADQVNDACCVMNYRNLWNAKHDYKNEKITVKIKNTSSHLGTVNND